MNRMNVEDLKQIKEILAIHTMSNLRKDVIKKLCVKIDLEISIIENKSMYDCIIRDLRTNDRNSTYDEIFEESNNLKVALLSLSECILRILDEDGCQFEELDFYKEIYNRILELQIIEGDL